MLDNRLKLCAEMVNGSGIVCDVGTDHAYLAAELIKTDKCRRVIASDIKQGPLDAAAKTVEKSGVKEKVELILSDGLENISLNGVSDVVIAGMGGETIADIIDKCAELCDSRVQLVLQPMTKAEVLRKYLGEKGFAVDSEKIAVDGEKMYVVMAAHYSGVKRFVSEKESLTGLLQPDTDKSEAFIQRKAAKLEKIAEQLISGGKEKEAAHYHSLALQLTSGKMYYDRDEIYSCLNSVYPFSAQEKWDNSGMLAEGTEKVSRVLLTLDIDNKAVSEAVFCGAEMIISHHPVIFSPLKKICRNTPVWQLIRGDITAICMHTNVDKSPEGTNGVILRKISERYELSGEPELLEDCGDGTGIGYICELKEETGSVQFGEFLREIFGCDAVRVNSCRSETVKRIAFCSGSGGSMLCEAVSRNCDAYITGDVKHDVWIDANNSGITLYDCGHFHTENPVLEEFRYILEKSFPLLDVIIAGSSADPVDYIR